MWPIRTKKIDCELNKQVYKQQQQNQQQHINLQWRRE